MSARFLSPLSAALIFVGAEAFVLVEPAEADESVTAPTEDSDAAAKTPHAKPVSPIDKFLKGAVEFFGADKLLGNDQTASTSNSQEPPNPSMFTQDPSQKQKSFGDRSIDQTVQDQPPTAPPPVEPVPPSVALAGAPASPLFIVPGGIPGAQTINSIVDSPQVLGSQQTLSGLFNTVGWAATVNAVGVMEGYTTYSSALSNVEGVTLSGSLSLAQSIVQQSADYVTSGQAANTAAGGASLWNSGLASAGNEWTSLGPTTLAGGWNSLLTSSYGTESFQSAFSGLEGYLENSLIVLGGATGLSNSVLGSEFTGLSKAVQTAPVSTALDEMDRRATILSAASSNAAPQLAGISALNSVEGQIAGDFVGRGPTLNGSPNLYVSRLFALLKK